MSTALQLTDMKPVAVVQAQRSAIVQLMQHAMKEGQDYGTIPGTGKPTLFKPGSEKLMSLFHLAGEPIVEDLSTPDMMRFRVMVRITEVGSGRYLGSGLGEASSAEEKYQWRASVCDEEFDETPEDRRRKKWRKSNNGAYAVKQVRTNMEDAANTVLKMAKKRAQIDAVLTVTAASEVFAQDLEDEVAIDIDGQPPANPRPQAARPAAQQQASSSRPPTGSSATITTAQASRFYAKWKANRQPDEVKEYLQTVCGIADSRQMSPAHYDAACLWADGKE
jgi:hypothetical protein